MRRASDEPPPVIDAARVLQYAVLNESVKYSGHSMLFVDGKELGPVPCLAIGQDLKSTEVFLFHCNQDWMALGVAAYKSVAEAKKKAEWIYPGVATRWSEAHFTEKEVSQYLDALWKGLHCAFCRKRPDEVEAIIEKNGITICDSCILELGQMLAND